eukprot:CAMPEP_0115606348 /NCGR_PEP_ID=MMETSP0272-20121206/17935_1 /TAXON_ID=71861 /ORGANISM="Scrippsiella trochoidea, Strain CCMP3099" /LENGTH=85 /DNA_ID=CAMNT_0003041975 /DNA_START=982 /DNA_END=1239 /DNA_ORIENTATION=-
MAMDLPPHVASGVSNVVRTTVGGPSSCKASQAAAASFTLPIVHLVKSSASNWLGVSMATRGSTYKRLRCIQFAIVAKHRVANIAA